MKTALQSYQESHPWKRTVNERGTGEQPLLWVSSPTFWCLYTHLDESFMERVQEENALKDIQDQTLSGSHLTQRSFFCTSFPHKAICDYCVSMEMNEWTKCSTQYRHNSETGVQHFKSFFKVGIEVGSGQMLWASQPVTQDLCVENLLQPLHTEQKALPHISVGSNIV